MSNGSPITVKGGSVTIEFSDSEFPPTGANKRFNGGKKITQVEVLDESERPLFSQKFSNGKVTVKVYYQ